MYLYLRRIEKGILDWVRFHQGELRAEKYRILIDAFRQSAGVEEVGVKIILPPTITG